MIWYFQLILSSILINAGRVSNVIEHIFSVVCFINYYLENCVTWSGNCYEYKNFKTSDRVNPNEAGRFDSSFYILINLVSIKIYAIVKQSIFFLYQSFLSQTLKIHRTAGEGRGPSFIPLYHFHPLTNIDTFICNFACEMTITYF